MLDSTVFMENSDGGGGSGGGSAADTEAANELRNEGEDGDKSVNRWPQEETLALLKIRSEMDTAFRDSNVKAPLWDEVSRKLGELGYHRSAKKCKEKFENIHKYHKRIKEGKSDRQNSKHYKFFDQLQLLDNNFQVPSTPTLPNTDQDHNLSKPKLVDSDAVEFMSASTSTSSSSGKDSESSVKKKRKMANYFERLMKDVLTKQEELQNKFLEALEKCEKDRIAREEAWKAEEMARIKKEREFLAQERAAASAKDEAVLAFLQKISQQIQIPIQIPEILNQTINNKPLEKSDNILEKLASKQDYVVGETSTPIERQDSGIVENAVVQTSSSRWPKAEVEALIMLKTDFDSKYQESGPKGPLWEEISSCMRKLGYDRNAKRCKEKWENINKYYKRVKESNKKRPVDSKTCPYFDMLDSLYLKRFKKSADHSSGYGGGNLKPEQILMEMMAQNEQNQQQMQESTGEFHDASDQQMQDEDDDVENERDDETGDDYQIGGNDLSTMATLE